MVFSSRAAFNKEDHFFGANWKIYVTCLKNPLVYHHSSFADKFISLPFMEEKMVTLFLKLMMRYEYRMRLVICFKRQIDGPARICTSFSETTLHFQSIASNKENLRKTACIT